MVMVRKNYRLPEDVISVIEKTKLENGFKTETETLIFILKEYERESKSYISEKDKQDIADILLEKMREKYKNQFDRIRLASTFAERYSFIILDAINTMLYDGEATFLMSASGETRHKVIRESENRFKEIIEKNKQIKDNENLKRG